MFRHNLELQIHQHQIYTLYWNYNPSNNNIRFEIQSSINNLFTPPIVIYITNMSQTGIGITQITTTKTRYFRIRAQRILNNITYSTSYNVTNNNQPISYPNNLGP